MAITKMKKLRVIALTESKDKLLSELLRLGCVEVSSQEDKLRDPEWQKLLRAEQSGSSETRHKLAEARTALDALKKYAEVKEGMFVKRFLVTEDKFLGSTSIAERACSEIKARLDEMNVRISERQRLENRRAALLPWKDLDLELENTGTEHTLFRIGTCPLATDIVAVNGALEETAAEVTKISQDTQLAYIFAVIHKDDKDAAMDILRSFGFSVATFSGESGTPEQAIAALDKQIAEVNADIFAIEGAIAGYKNLDDEIKIYIDRLNAELSKQGGEENFLTDGTISFFEGWCPAEKEEAVTKLFDELGCAYEFADPTEEDIPDVPVKLKNNKVTDALNMVTEMYSLPSYANVDPNPLIAPFFILFYGIMMADMGYGLLMILAGLIINKKYAPKGTAKHLFSLMFYCGITTFIMGAVTGGFFGDFIPQICKLINPESTFDLPHLFTPLNDTMMILIGCMALGFVHIITGMMVSVAIKIRRKEYMSILWNEVTWWVIFAGIALMVLKITNIVIYVGIGMVVVGSGWDAKGFGKVTAIFSSIYNNVTGYFGDILSYSRLMALMLAGSVIASVFNTLGCIPGGVIPFVVISLIGNALNFALNILGCYVHDLRLQCLEFFNKFYEDGGKPFRPIAINTKYVDIK